MDRTAPQPQVADESLDSAGGAATTGSGRVGNVDVLRAVAAFAVLAIHAYALGGRAVPITADYWYDVPLAALATGVWLFFAISGYVISKPFVDRLLSDRPLPELVPYALRRGFRIFPLYWIALTGVIVIEGLGGTRLWQVPFHYVLLQNTVPGQQEALLTVAWTLTIEVIFYVAMPLAAFAVRRWGGRVTAERLALIVVASWIASIALTLLSDLGGITATTTWLRGLFPMLWQMFCPGILLAIAPHLKAPGWRRWLAEEPAHGRALIVAFALLTGAAIVSEAAPMRFGAVPYLMMRDLTRPLFALGYGIVLVIAIRSRPWSETLGGWVLRLGLVSYGIYLLHAVIGAFLLSSAGDQFIPLPHGGLLAFAVHVAFLSALTIPLALASWRWLEEPMLRLASRLSDRWRASCADMSSGLTRPAAADRRSG